MARDVDKNILLYFYSSDFIWSGEIGSSGDSDNYVLPSGMTSVEPPTVPVGQQAIFDEDLQTWSLGWIKSYDGLTTEEQVAWDVAVAKQAAIDAAQNKVIDRMAEAVDGIYKVMLRESVLLNLTDPEIAYGNEFRDDYAAWKALQ